MYSMGVLWLDLHTHTPVLPNTEFKLWVDFFFYSFFAVQQLFHESYHAPLNHIFINTLLTISNLWGTHLAMACDSPKPGICENKNKHTYN